MSTCPVSFVPTQNNISMKIMDTNKKERLKKE